MRAMDKGDIMKPKQEWKPKVGDTVWDIDTDYNYFKVLSYVYEGADLTDTDFRTRSLARKALKEVKKVLANCKHY